MGEVHYVELSEDGRFAMTASLGDRMVRGWDVRAGKQTSQIGHNTDIVCRFDMSSDGRLAVIGTIHDLRVVDLHSGQLVHHWGGAAYAAAISPDGRHAAWGAGSSSATVRSIVSGADEGRYEGRTGKVYGIRFSPDGRVLAVGGPAGDVSVWNLRTGAALPHLKVDGAATTLRLSADGSRLLVQWNPATVWDTVRGQKLYEITTATGACSLSPDGRTALVPVGNDIVLWGLP
jgi:WD40 repeat protein